MTDPERPAMNGCLVALIVVLGVVGLLFGTCLLMVR